MQTANKPVQQHFVINSQNYQQRYMMLVAFHVAKEQLFKQEVKQ